jgi:hypothetical protein
MAYGYMCSFLAYEGRYGGTAYSGWALLGAALTMLCIVDLRHRAWKEENRALVIHPQTGQAYFDPDALAQLRRIKRDVASLVKNYVAILGTSECVPVTWQTDAPNEERIADWWLKWERHTPWSDWRFQQHDLWSPLPVGIVQNGGTYGATYTLEFESADAIGAVPSVPGL